MLGKLCRMAAVFSLFTHANEQYADEQTWARPASLLHTTGRMHVSLLCVGSDGCFIF